MRRAVVVLALMVGLAPEGRAEREVEGWIGTWTGTASWKDCTVEGAGELAVPVTWHDGTTWIDGAAIYEGLGEVAPEGREGGALVHEVDGLSISLAPGKAGQATLTLRTAAKCRMTAKLTREGTGLGACDDLLALARVAGECQVEVDDDPSDEVEGWRALKKKARKRAVAACGRRADALRERLVAADCLPPADDPADLPACRDVWRIAQRLLRCGHMPVHHQQSMIEAMSNLRRSLRPLAGREGGEDLAIAQCDETAEMLKVSAEALHCDL